MPPPTPAPQYHGGCLDVPAGTGVQSVNIKPGWAPDAVVFIGSNSPVEDAVVTGDNLGVFMGFMGRQYDTSALLSYAVSVLPEQGGRTAAAPIMMNATWNTQAYRADAVSLDADGFSINWTDGGAGVVYYLAIQAAEPGQCVMIPAPADGGASAVLGWIGKAMLAMCYRSGSAETGADVFAGLHHASFGGGCFVDDRLPEQGGGYISVVSGNSNRHEVHAAANQAAQLVMSSGGYTGPFLHQQGVVAKPTGTPPTTFTANTFPENLARYLVWDAEGVCGFLVPSGSVGGHRDYDLITDDAFHTGNALVERVAALVCQSIGDSSGDANNPCTNLGFALACEDENGTFQASVFCDGVASPRTLMNSPTSIIVDVDGAAASRVEVAFAEGEPGTFRATTLAVAGTMGTNTVFHAFGGEIEDEELPQIYRHGSRYRY